MAKLEDLLPTKAVKQAMANLPTVDAAVSVAAGRQVQLHLDMTDPKGTPDLSLAKWSNKQLLQTSERIKAEIWARVQAGTWEKAVEGFVPEHRQEA